MDIIGLLLGSAPLDLSGVGVDLLVWLSAGAGAGLAIFAMGWGLKIAVSAFNESTDRRNLEHARRTGDTEYVESWERAESLRRSRND